MLSLVESFLKAGILEEMTTWTPEEGAPKGAVLSPLLSNVFLNPLDHLMIQRGFEMIRYADDFVILCRTAEDAEKALEIVREWVADNGLTLHPTKTKIVEARADGFEFLGYRFVQAPSPPAGQKPAEGQRGNPCEDETGLGEQPDVHRGGPEPHVARMVRVLPAQSPSYVQATRWLDSDALAEHSS